MTSSKTTWLLGSFTLAAVIVCGFVETGDADAQAGPDAPKFEPVMPLENLMHEQDRHFNMILELLRNEEAEHWSEKFAHSAYALAEMGNLNAYQDRALQHADYRKWTGEIKEQALELTKLASVEKIAEAKDVARKINSTCNACHDKYEH